MNRYGKALSLLVIASLLGTMLFAPTNVGMTGALDSYAYTYNGEYTDSVPEDYPYSKPATRAEAQANYDEALEAYESAQESLEEAKSVYETAKIKTDDKIKEIQEKAESDARAALDEYNAANEALAAALALKTTYEQNIADLNAAKEEAETLLEELLSENPDMNLEAATEAREKAENDLNSAEELKKNLESELEAAEEELAIAEAELAAANELLEIAENNVAECDSRVKTITDAIANLRTELLGIEEGSDAYTEAEQAIADAEAELESAQASKRLADAEKTKADDAVVEAQNAVDRAKEACSNPNGNVTEEPAENPASETEEEEELEEGSYAAQIREEREKIKTLTEELEALNAEYEAAKNDLDDANAAYEEAKAEWEKSGWDFLNSKALEGFTIEELLEKMKEIDERSIETRWGDVRVRTKSGELIFDSGKNEELLKNKTFGYLHPTNIRDSLYFIKQCNEIRKNAPNDPIDSTIIGIDPVEDLEISYNTMITAALSAALTDMCNDKYHPFISPDNAGHEAEILAWVNEPFMNDEHSWYVWEKYNYENDSGQTGHYKAMLGRTCRITGFAIDNRGGSGTICQQFNSSNPDHHYIQSISDFETSLNEWVAPYERNYNEKNDAKTKSQTAFNTKKLSLSTKIKKVEKAIEDATSGINAIIVQVAENVESCNANLATANQNLDDMKDRATEIKTEIETKENSTELYEARANLTAANNEKEAAETGVSTYTTIKNSTQNKVNRLNAEISEIDIEALTDIFEGTREIENAFKFTESYQSKVEEENNKIKELNLATLEEALSEKDSAITIAEEAEAKANDISRSDQGSYADYPEIKELIEAESDALDYYQNTTNVDFENAKRHLENAESDLDSMCRLSKVEAKKATATTDGVKEHYSCMDCGNWYWDAAGEKLIEDYSDAIIPRVSNIKLNYASYTYNGYVKTPTLYVKDSTGKALINGTDYTYTRSSGRKNVGTYYYYVTFKGNYSGKVTVSFKINPKGATIKTPSAGKGYFTAKWSKQSSKMSKYRITGYQIAYSTKTDFSGAKYSYRTKYSYTSKKISKLKRKTYYYVKVRTYLKTGGKTYYSGWSKVKKVKTK